MVLDSGKLWYHKLPIQFKAQIWPIMKNSIIAFLINKDSRLLFWEILHAIHVYLITLDYLIKKIILAY